jgi:hypothetical protein
MYVNVLDIIHRSSLLKHNVSETESETWCFKKIGRRLMLKILTYII